MSRRSARRSLVCGHAQSSSASILAASASTGAAFQPRRCCALSELYHSDAPRRRLRNPNEGLERRSPTKVIAKVVARSRKVARQLSAGVAHLLKKEQGHRSSTDMARLAGPGRQRIAKVSKDSKASKTAAETLGQAHYSWPPERGRAPWCRPQEPDGKLDLELSSEAMVPRAHAQARCWSIGSGAIGMEFASVLSRSWARR